ncbi:DUF2184 domain-containing protein [Campylobacter sp. faydin G-24]|uniref:DUF2184 domain-containing protein n=1 Tax=Campylobacter anatolicus TaxID=2829105 RepID=A0ABS5HJ51_9BACT|nr:major capsid family protein [Campylobacter anatolicus]MBR8461483.1 DUF2184 domain-containing protein [Campylobacter anatolicus]MBR8464286.1 DUF2184 domain-containing protein [Campylobacter anatolicus]
MARLTDADILNEIINTATSFNEGFKERQYPEVALAKFMSITQNGDESIDAIDYGEIEGTQDLENGLIDENTTSLETEDVYINAKKGVYLNWAKGAIYTTQGVARAKALGINLDTTKLQNLERVALLTAQKTALVGHPKVKAVEGLLTNKSVKRGERLTNTPLSSMSSMEARDFFLRMIDFGYATNGGLLIPDTVAIDAKDLMSLASKYDETITVNGMVSALTSIKQAINESTGVNINILGIPLGFATNLSAKGKNRAVVYTNSEDVVSTDWAIAPTAMPPFARSSLSYEVAIRAKFTGALIRQLDKIAYVDYEA